MSTEFRGQFTSSRWWTARRNNMNNKDQISRRRKILLLRLESIVGNSCYGTFIQNYGPNGVWESEGRWIRYPITFRRDRAKGLKTERIRLEEISDGMILDGVYKFGANHLHIMSALDEILKYLEREYGLSVD
jgi:hypothetical protein